VPGIRVALIFYHQSTATEEESRFKGAQPFSTLFYDLPGIIVESSKSLKNSPNGLYGDIPISSILRCWKFIFELQVGTVREMTRQQVGNQREGWGMRVNLRRFE